MYKKWVVTNFTFRKLKVARKTIRDEDLDIKLYCPVISVVYKDIYRRLRTKKLPMLFHYTFAHYNPDVYDYKTLRDYLPMCRPLMRNKKLIVVPYKEIKRVKLIEKQQRELHQLHTENVVLRANDYLNQNVLVRDGTLSGIFGIVTDVTKTGKLMVEIFIFNRLLNCNMDVDDVEIVRT